MPAAPFFRALAEHTRLRIVNLLTRGSLCVCDIQRILGQPQSSVSRHLAYLKAARLMTDRRDGVRTFYALAPTDDRLRRAVFEAIRRHLSAAADFADDLHALERLRAAGECHEEPARERKQKRSRCHVRSRR
jgi:ArsR family transcriptional regulator